ncbi:MAG: cytochrome C oxidase subunit IV family protein [Deltaproteobacteria bacterium]|nr:cytochrome C oxidase subunit IV family protein [Deltaproteobacteria bacterium]
MRSVLCSRTTLIYVLLVLATAVAWGAAEGSVASGTAAVIIVVIAALKQRAVVLHFMELREAPVVWRCLFEGFLVLAAGAILYGYWLGTA